MHFHRDSSSALLRFIFVCLTALSFAATAQTAAPTPPNYPAPQEKSAILKDYGYCISNF